MTLELRFGAMAVILVSTLAAHSLADSPRTPGPISDAVGLGQEGGPPPALGDTVTTEGGLKYIVIISGDGRRAERGRPVQVHYTGWLEDGTLFDSSLLSGEPAEFELGAGAVIRAWDEAVNLMHVGDKWRLIVPPELGYGGRGVAGAIPPDATLIFDIALIKVR